MSPNNSNTKGHPEPCVEAETVEKHSFLLTFLVCFATLSRALVKQTGSASIPPLLIAWVARPLVW